MRNLNAATRSVFQAALLWLVVVRAPAAAQNVQLSLNVFPTSNANASAGGTWALFAKTDSANGIAGIDSFIAGINTTGVSYAPGINAALDGGNPYVTPGNPVELLYFQDTSLPGVVVGVGAPTFSPGLDPLGSPAWDNATKIATGSYSGVVPSFAPNGTAVTDA